MLKLTPLIIWAGTDDNWCDWMSILTFRSLNYTNLSHEIFDILSEKNANHKHDQRIGNKHDVKDPLIDTIPSLAGLFLHRAFGSRLTHGTLSLSIQLQKQDSQTNQYSYKERPFHQVTKVRIDAFGLSL